MAKGSLRGTYGKTLADLGKSMDNLVVLDADLAKSTKTITFAKEFKDRFIDMGLAEQDMVSTAAGISLTDKVVFASSFCVFLSGRVYDQVRQSVCYNNANVKLVGTHAGLGVGEDGATHQSLEDIALMRPLPNMRVIVPADSVETDQVIRYVANEPGPFFVRLTRSDLPIVHDEQYQYEFGKASVLREGSDCAIFAIGAMVGKAIDAADQLKSKGINCSVINLSTIKPFDEDCVLKYAKQCGKVLTVEDHSVYGGLGSTVAEFLAQNHPVKMKLMGTCNQFGKSGSPEELYCCYGLAVDDILEEIQLLLD